MAMLCNPVTKLKQFYEGNRSKCRKRKKCVHRPKSSTSFADVDDKNYVFLSKHVEDMRKYVFGKLDDNIKFQRLGNYLPYTKLFQLIPTGSELGLTASTVRRRRDVGSDTDKEDILQHYFAGNGEILHSTNYQNNNTNELLQEIDALRETVDKLGKDKEELEGKLQQLENKNSVTYTALKVELESSNLVKMKLNKEIEYLETQMEKSKIEYKMQIGNLEDQVKVEKEKIKGYASQICFTKLKLNDAVSLKKETEENLKEKIKIVKKENVEHRVTISQLEKVNVELSNKIKDSEEYSFKEITRLKNLSKEVEQKTIELQNELRKTKSAWSIESTNLKAQLEEYSLKSTSLTTQVEVQKEKNVKFGQVLSKLRENIVHIEKEKINLKCNTMFQSKEIAMLGDKIKQLSTLSIDLKKQVDVLKDSECKLNHSLTEKEKELENMCSDKNCLKQDVHNLYREMELIKNENSQISLYLNELKSKLKAYKDDKIQIMKSLDQKTKEVEKLIGQKCVLNNKVTALSQEKSCLQERVNELLQDLCRSEAKNKDTKNKIDVTNLKKRNNNMRRTITQQLSQSSSETNISCNENDLNKYLAKCLKCGIKSLDIYELAVLHKSICGATQSLTRQISSECTTSVCCHNNRSSELLEYELDGLQRRFNTLKVCSKKEIDRIVKELDEMRLENCMLRFDFNNQNIILHTYKKSAHKLQMIASKCRCQNLSSQNERSQRPDIDRYGNEMNVSISKNLEWKV